MPKPHYVFLVAALWAIPLAGKAAAPDPEKTRQLLAIVQSEADLAARARALQQLALVATRDAVPPISALLADDKLGQYARDVLEQMPDPAAATALRSALGQLKGKALIGVINSLGIRGDEGSVGPLSGLAADRAPEIAGPALLALGRIGNPDAVRVIEPAITRGPAELRHAAAEAGLIVAERQAREGQTAAALALYDRIRLAELPLPLRVSATRGAMALSGLGGLGLIIEQLHSRELAMRDVALMAVRELRTPEVTPALVNELDRLEAGMQGLVIAALAERGDDTARPAIEARAKTGDEEVRVAALEALGRIGRVSSLPILLEAVSRPSSPAVGAAALASLARIPASEANEFVQRALPRADPELRVKLIGVLADRNAGSATSELMKLASDGDIETAKAALRALGVVARPGDLPQLIRLAVSVPDETAKSLADRALVTTAMKILQPERRADAVLAAFKGERNPTTKSALVRPLAGIVRSMGGSHEVFFALRAALPESSVRTAALKALADWPDATPTTLLLAIANDPATPPAERDISLSGAVRMAANVAAGRERSSLNVVEALAQANRGVSTKVEKLMIVSALGNLKRPEALAMLQPYLDDPAVQSEASLALLQIAPALMAGPEAGKLRGLLGKIAATDQDEAVRRKAVQVGRGVPPPAVKQKAKGRKAISAAALAAPGPGLFNGRDLGGWDGDPAVWRVRDGVIVGGSLEGNPRNEFLATTRPYRNFLLRLEYRLVGTDGFVNGGVQLRSVRVAEPANEMSGYQADIGAGHSGSLYDETRRKKFLARADASQIKQLEKVGDWNRYEIRCEGPKIELTLNGQKTVTYTEEDPSVQPEGLIALQIHGNCKAEIAFRNLELTELPSDN